jgi:hypothetical protein
MTDVWAEKPKTALSPREVVQVAHAHLVCGIDQHALAAMFGVNAGRIAEAVSVMRNAAENHRKIYQQRKVAV